MDRPTDDTRNYNSCCSWFPADINVVKYLILALFYKQELAPVIEENAIVNQSCHEIDTTNYVPVDDEVTANLLSQSVLVETKGADPFDEQLIARFLTSLETPITCYPNFYRLEEELPHFAVDTAICIGTT